MATLKELYENSKKLGIVEIDTPIEWQEPRIEPIFKMITITGVVEGSKGSHYTMRMKFHITPENTPDFDKKVQVDCDCHHFKWALYPYLKQVGATLYSDRERERYEVKGTGHDPNPTKTPALCKHLMNMARKVAEMFNYDL